ncbi:TonB-dependent receptor [Thalassotalea fonticola]|uniref:TonB-dependent receptor n=1 Tax=Thalassotalea fonticola TaxID=3065649 RepID=A0ABZ0GVN8_9GAMM|nr:TonB-dependent receptor [Colwelliaceae bacterium S1-1]
MRRQFSKSKIASYVCLALASSTTFAAEEVEIADEIEVIEVTGVRSSLTGEVAAKRASDAISDSIIAEDMGKSSDENIAEAISRIAGISLDEGGSTITVRGIEAALNDIKLNGVSMTSSTDDQAVDLSLFSADMLSRIDVVKSPAANQEEGSLGASINLQTRSPLSSKKTKHIFSTEARYNELNEETTPRFSYSFVKNASDTLGFAGSFFHDKQIMRKEEISTNSWDLIHFYDVDKGGEAIDNQSVGTKIYDFDTGAELTTITALTAGRGGIKNKIFIDEKVKKGGTFTVQYQPGENTDIRLDTTFTRQNLDRQESQMQMKNFAKKTGTDHEIYVNQGQGDVNTVYGFKQIGATGIVQPKEKDSTTDTLLLGLNVSHLIGDYWRINGRLGYSDTQQEEDGYQANWGENGPKNVANDFCSVTYVNGPENDFLPEMGMCSRFDASDPEALRLTQFRQTVRDVDDSKHSAYLDVERVFDDSIITSIEFGAKYTDRTKFVRDESMKLGNSYFEERLFSATGITDNNITGGEFLDGIAPAGAPQSWIYPNMQETIARIAPNGFDQEGFPVDPALSSEQRETTYGAYAQANFEFLDGIVRGNFGMRYANTEIKANSQSSMAFADGIDYVMSFMALEENGGDATETLYKFNNIETNEYHNWLPSATITWTISDDLLFRAAAARVMARPKIRDTRPSYKVRADVEGDTPRGDGGNSVLKPYLADQYDMALEWYFDEGALLSANVFYKDYASFNYSTRTGKVFAGEDFPLYGHEGAPDCLIDQSLITEDNPLPCAEVDYKAKRNGGSADIKGIEISYQQHYDFLPGLLKHLGSSINYTYADSDAIPVPEDLSSPYNNLPFPNTSKHSANARVYWENDWSSYRFAYSYRSESLDEVVNSGAGTTVRDAKGTLDFSANWDLTKQLKLSFAATNLTNSYDKTLFLLTDTTGYEGVDGVFKEMNSDLEDLSDKRVKKITSYGRAYRLSLRYQF